MLKYKRKEKVINLVHIYERQDLILLIKWTKFINLVRIYEQGADVNE